MVVHMGVGREKGTFLENECWGKLDGKTLGKNVQCHGVFPKAQQQFSVIVAPIGEPVKIHQKSPKVSAKEASI